MSDRIGFPRVADRVRGEVSRTKNSRWLNALARAGLIAQGASFAIVGVLAIKLALGDGGKATSRQGALASMAHHTFGKILLVLLAIGFACYAIWRFAQTFLDKNHEGDGIKGLAKRAGYFGRGAVYSGLTFTTIKILTGSGQQQSQNAKAHKTTATVLSWPGGKWIVGIAGLCLIGAGLYNGYRGVTKKFLEKWRTGKMSETERHWGERSGVVGLIARMVVFGLIGIFVTKAAIDYNSKEAIGLDGALQKLANHSYGSWLVGLVAAGLIAYAIFCAFEARYREV